MREERAIKAMPVYDVADYKVDSNWLICLTGALRINKRDDEGHCPE